MMKKQALRAVTYCLIKIFFVSLQHGSHKLF